MEAARSPARAPLECLGMLSVIASNALSSAVEILASSGLFKQTHERRANTGVRGQARCDQHAVPSGRGLYEFRNFVAGGMTRMRSRCETRPRDATNKIPRPGRREADVPRRRDGHLGTRVGALSGKVRPTQRRAARRRREGAPRRRSSARARASASGSPPLPKRSTPVISVGAHSERFNWNSMQPSSMHRSRRYCFGVN